MKHKGLAIINRGIVGSGKSTFAACLKKAAISEGVDTEIFNTDSLFRVDGEYKFNPEKLGENHSQNYHNRN